MEWNKGIYKSVPKRHRILVSQSIVQTIEKHGGRYVARGGAEVLEGDGKGLNTFVILEFPSVEAANAWYNDPEYAPMITLRQTGSEGDLVVLEGV